MAILLLLTYISQQLWEQFLVFLVAEITTSRCSVLQRTISLLFFFRLSIHMYNFHICTVHLDTIKVFYLPTDAQ